MLAITKNGTTSGTTEDVFEASSAAQAEADAIRMEGRRAAPRFRPLVTDARR